MPGESHADELARACVSGRKELRRAAQVLHDDAGSLLAVAGLRLQLLRMDFPDADARAAEVGEALDGVMEHLRVLSRALEPSPVRRTGLKNALLNLAAGSQGAHVQLRYTAKVTLPLEIADAMYHAIADSIAAAKHMGAIVISVAGSRSVTARVSLPKKVAAKAFAATALLARHSGLDFSVTTEKGTIVSIQYAIRRPSRG